jgi:hypothetical protein
MTFFPLLAILFAIALFFNQGSQSITVTRPSPKTAVTWTLQPEGHWHAVDSEGIDLGDWSYTDSTVTVRKGSSSRSEKLTDLLDLHPEGAKSEIIIAGQRVKIAFVANTNKLLLSPEDDQGALKSQTTIEYVKQP